MLQEIITMSNTGVLPFVRGVDFTRNDFSVSFNYEIIHNLYIIDDFILFLAR